jgi:hypothetical protein
LKKVHGFFKKFIWSLDDAMVWFHFTNMNTIDEIENVVRMLPRDELAMFRDWFVKFDAEAWDAQLEADVSAKLLDDLASEALADVKAGRAKSL